MLSEQPPFGNVALISDNDQLHRIGPIGNRDAELPRMSASAMIQSDGRGSCVAHRLGARLRPRLRMTN